MELILFMVFASVVAFGLAGAAIAWRRPAQRRLARLADGSRSPVTHGESEGLLADQRPGMIERVLAPLAGRSADAGRVGPLRQRLVQAGFRRESAPAIYMGSRVALALTLPSVVLTLPLALTLTSVQLAVLVMMAAGLGMVGPSWWVDRRRAARMLEIELGLPDALDLMVVCVEAGLGINASLSRVAKEFALSHPTLAAEFELATLETRAGKSTAESLRALAERTGVSEISTLVAMLIQTERFGTNLADTLRVHADAMRVQRLQRAEEMAAKAPLKMLFPTVLIFVATLLVTIGPGMLQLTQFFRNVGN